MIRRGYYGGASVAVSSGAAAVAATYLPTVASTPTAVYSTHKLVSGYAGDLFRVVRASDSTTLDVAANADGTPDISGLAAFLSATTGKVDIVYDQMGSANHATQTTNGNRPTIQLANAINGHQPITFLANSSHLLTIPAAVTGDGRATTAFDIAACLSASSGNAGGNQAAYTLGALWNTAGSLTRLWSNTGTTSLTTLAFNSTNKFARSQPQVTAQASSAASVIVHQDGRPTSTQAATTAGTWAGGRIGSVGAALNYMSDQDWFGLIVYPTTLSGTDVGLVKTALYTIFAINTTANAQVVLPGNSIVQGAQATNLFNNPRQADPLISRPIYLLDCGIFGQTAATANTDRARYNGNFRADLTYNLMVAPEPTNDIDVVTSAPIFTAVVLASAASITSGSAIVTGISSTTTLSVGQSVTGAGIPNTATILTVDSASQVTLNINATATNAAAALTFRAIFTATRTSGSPILTSVTSTAGLTAGMVLTGTGIPYFSWNTVTPPTTIVSVDSGVQITMSANASASGTTAITATDLVLCQAQGESYYTASVSPFIVAAKAAGFSVIAPTTIARIWTGTSAGSLKLFQLDQIRLFYNAKVRARAVADGYTVADYAGVTNLRDPTNTAYIADNVHPNTTGYAQMAPVLAAAVNALI